MKKRKTNGENNCEKSDFRAQKEWLGLPLINLTVGLLNYSRLNKHWFFSLLNTHVCKLLWKRFYNLISLFCNRNRRLSKLSELRYLLKMLLIHNSISWARDPWLPKTSLVEVGIMSQNYLFSLHVYENEVTSVVECQIHAPHDYCVITI